MKTFTLQYESNYESMMSGYITEAVTSKGIISLRGINLKKERAERWAAEDNAKAPYWDENWQCTVYHVRVVETTIFVY